MYDSEPWLVPLVLVHAVDTEPDPPSDMVSAFMLGPSPKQVPQPNLFPDWLTPMTGDDICDLSRWIVTFTPTGRIYRHPHGMHEYPERSEPSAHVRRHAAWWRSHR